MLALPALQAISALLAEFSGPSPFPLAMFAVPFLAPCEAICAHRQGDMLRRAGSLNVGKQTQGTQKTRPPPSFPV